MCRNFSESLRKFESLYILQASAANEVSDRRFVLNSKQIERFSVAMYIKNIHPSGICVSGEIRIRVRIVYW